MPLPPALVERFARHLAEVRDEVVAMEAGLAAGEDRGEALRAVAHKLAGTAAAYGFPAVGERARELEAAILADSAGVSADRVGALHTALSEAAAEGPA